MMKNTNKLIRSYSELIRISDFKDRFEYCKVFGKVGEDTFGSRRWLNQYFYNTIEYRRLRQEIIRRDLGNDLAHEDYPIRGIVVVHHLNPITKEDILERSAFVWNPEYMICVSDGTHKAIHYSNYGLIDKSFSERKPNDTCPWRKE